MRTLIGLFRACAWGGLGLALAAVASCSDSGTLAQLRELGEGCLLSSDCDDDLVCVFRRCHVECETTKDCRDRGDDALCVKGRAPSNVCLLPDEIECNVGEDENGLDVFRHNTCPGDNLRCARDGRCRDACVVDEQCIGSSVCATTGVCAEPEELTEGNPITEEGEVGHPTATCRLTTQCAAPLSCREGLCGPACFDDRDCLPTERCDQVQSLALGVSFGDCRSLEHPEGVPESCFDGALGENETDVDCGGGDCLRCGSGFTCQLDADCASDICQGMICQVPGCGDGAENANETDIDCGGPQCAPCAAVGDGCIFDVDCAAPNRCDPATYTCAAPSCSDGIRNQDEPSTDCGGSSCPACPDGSSCDEGSDCASKKCLGGLCAASTCTDGILNGNETDTDCGAGCPKCGVGATCTTGGDCTTGSCSTTCQAPACNDGALNGFETDEDCGGPCTPCAVGQLCNVDADCQSDGCSPSTGQCVAKHTLDIVITGEAGSKVVSSVAGIVSCVDGPCSYTFFPGESVTLYAIPVFGGAFQTFSGAGCPANQDSCTVTFDGDKTVTATFD